KNATNRLADLIAEIARSKTNPNQTELLKLRGEVGLLRNTAEEYNQLKRDERLSFSVEDVFTVRHTHTVEAIGKLTEAIKAYSESHGGNHPQSLDELQAT